MKGPKISRPNDILQGFHLHPRRRPRCLSVPVLSPTCTIHQKCNSGPVKCCGTLSDANNASALKQLSQLGISVENVTGQIGFQCNPITLSSVLAQAQEQTGTFLLRYQNGKSVLLVWKSSWDSLALRYSSICCFSLSYPSFACFSYCNTACSPITMQVSIWISKLCRAHYWSKPCTKMLDLYNTRRLIWPRQIKFRLTIPWPFLVRNPFLRNNYHF